MEFIFDHPINLGDITAPSGNAEVTAWVTPGPRYSYDVTIERVVVDLGGIEINVTHRLAPRVIAAMQGRALELHQACCAEVQKLYRFRAVA